MNAGLTRLTFILLQICWPLLCAHYLTGLKCHPRLRDSWNHLFVPREEDSGNVNNPCWDQNRSFHLWRSFAVVAPHSIIIMREVQLDKVYNGGFKCHRAGPDISLFDMESEWEQKSSQGELISTSEITNSTLSQSPEERLARLLWRLLLPYNARLPLLNHYNECIY